MQQPFYKRPIVWVILLVLVTIILAIILLNPSSSQNISQNLSLRLSNEPKPGSCLILEEKYCKSVKFIQDPITDGSLAVYKLSPKTTLFSPVDGFQGTATFFFKDRSILYPGVSINVGRDNTIETRTAIYSFIFYGKVDANKSSAKKGEVISELSDKTIDSLGDYNLAVRITKQTNYTVDDRSLGHSANTKVYYGDGSDLLKKLLENDKSK